MTSILNRKTAKIVQPSIWRVRGRVFDFSVNRPAWMAILNITPDSFSDGGLFSDPDRALDRALELEAQGADILDVGGESTRPGSDPVSVEEELRRVLPALERILPKIKIPVSIDTSKPEVMLAALDLGASIINDVAALEHAGEALADIARFGAGVVLMHKRGIPKTMQSNVEYDYVVSDVSMALAEAVRRASDAGIPRSNIAVDPGIGFGKSVEGNCALISAAGEIRKRTGCPVMVGLSRKSFLSKINAPKADLEAANAAAHSVAFLSGADILRVHDLSGARAAVDTARAIRGV